MKCSLEANIMVINVPEDLASVLSEHAKERGIAPDILALETLRRQFVVIPPPKPANERQRRLFEAAVDCGVSVPNWALSSEGLYD
jgi:hypothetical protein